MLVRAYGPARRHLGSIPRKLGGARPAGPVDTLVWNCKFPLEGGRTGAETRIPDGNRTDEEWDPAI